MNAKVLKFSPGVRNSVCEPSPEVIARHPDVSHWDVGRVHQPFVDPSLTDAGIVPAARELGDPADPEVIEVIGNRPPNEHVRSNSGSFQVGLRTPLPQTILRIVL